MVVLVVVFGRRHRGRGGGHGRFVAVVVVVVVVGRFVTVVVVVVVVFRGGDSVCAQWGRVFNHVEPWMAYKKVCSSIFSCEIV